MDLIKKKEQKLIELKQMFEKDQHELAMNGAFDLQLDFLSPGRIKSLDVITNEDFYSIEFPMKQLFQIKFNDLSLITCNYDTQTKTAMLLLGPDKRIQLAAYSVG